MSQSPPQQPSGLNTEIVSWLFHPSQTDARGGLTQILREANPGTVIHDLLKDGPSQQNAEGLADALLALKEVKEPDPETEAGALNALRLRAMEDKLAAILETRRAVEQAVALPPRPAPVRVAPVLPPRPTPVTVTPAAPAEPAPAGVPSPAAPAIPIDLREQALALFQKNDVTSFNKLREDNPTWLPDLQGADLQGADLQGADLQGADLQGADLQGADLQGAKNLRADQLAQAYSLENIRADEQVSKLVEVARAAKAARTPAPAAPAPAPAAEPAEGPAAAPAAAAPAPVEPAAAPTPTPEATYAAYEKALISDQALWAGIDSGDVDAKEAAQRRIEEALGQARGINCAPHPLLLVAYRRVNDDLKIDSGADERHEDFMDVLRDPRCDEACMRLIADQLPGISGVTLDDLLVDILADDSVPAAHRINLARESDDPDVCFNLARLLEQKGQTGDAIQSYKRAVWFYRAAHDTERQASAQAQVARLKGSQA